MDGDPTALRLALEALRTSVERLRLVVETLAEGVVLLDEEGRVVAANAAARALHAGADEPGALVVAADGAPVAPEERPTARTRRTGEPVTREVLGVVPPDGARRWLSVTTRALPRPDGPPYAVVATLADLTAERRAEHEAAQRAPELERVGAQRLGVLEAMVAQSEVGLAFVDPELRFVRVNDAMAAINHLPVEAHLGRTLVDLFGPAGRPAQELLARVRDSGLPVVDAEVQAAGRGTQDGEVRHYRATYWPVRDETGTLLGITSLVTDVTEVRRAEAERERLLERERRAAERTARLQWVTAALSSALTAREVAEVLAREGAGAVDAERGWVSLLSPDGRTLELVASVGYPEDAVRRFSRLPADAPLPGPDALRDGQARFFASAGELGRRYPELEPAYRDGGNEAGAVVPIVGPRGPLGFLAVADTEPHAFPGDDRALLATIARQCGQALDRALVYEREHATADSLAHSLLPERLPDVPGVQLAARYAPAPSALATVGGDFYDAFPAGGDTWVLVIGDVCGKGPDAAALTALVRWTLRAEAVHDSRPRHLLRRVNDAILAQRDDLRFCTMACARLELGPHAPALRLSCAGHPAPLLLDGDGLARPADVGGALLGVLARPELEEATFALAPGGGVVLYTDGLLEAHAPERILLPEDLAAAWGPARGLGLTALAELLHERAVDPALGPPRDDVALLAARLTPR